MSALRLPLAVKIPAVVLVFMAMVAVFVSERVLSRLAEAQTRHSATSRPSTSTGSRRRSSTRWSARTSGRCSTSSTGRARPMPGSSRPRRSSRLADGRVLASSDPRVASPRGRPAAVVPDPAGPGAGIVVRDEDARAVARRDLSSGGRWSDRSTPPSTSRRCSLSAARCCWR